MEYEEVGLKVGLEIHQQLDTSTKLFCTCPTKLREVKEAKEEFVRYLRPSKSELGEIDRAALEESKVKKRFRYKSYDSTCLIEEDEEPPRKLDQEALEIALEISGLLDMDPVDQAHVMRKIVIDGSNTTGFQRTSLIATNGKIDTQEGEVGIDSLCLEEESARKLENTTVSDQEEIIYSLDRLGIPLIEIGTKPDIKTPNQAQETAEKLGEILRSTLKVKRGLGTIRQDLNVSVRKGSRTEIKGVQDLDSIGEIVEKEMERQITLLDISDKLNKKNADIGESKDISYIFEDTDSDIINKNLESGGIVKGILVRGFKGLLGREIQEGKRLGTEMSERAQKRGAGGIFHTDELPKYGIKQDEIDKIFEEFNAKKEDAVVFVADSEKTANKAIEAIKERASQAMQGVPEETRQANDDSTTSYLRPLPGAARMYPETDVSPVDLPKNIQTPPLLSERAEQYKKEHGLNKDLAERIAFGEKVKIYEKAVKKGINPMLIAQTLENTLIELRRDGIDVEKLEDDDILKVLELVEKDEIAKEGVPDLLRSVSEGKKIDKAIKELGLDSAGREKVEEVVDKIIEQNKNMVEEKGQEAFGALMGDVMEELRGKADGEVVSEVLRERLS